MHGRRTHWSEHELTTLTTLRTQGMPITLISERLGRSYKAVTHMLERQAPDLVRRRTVLRSGAQNSVASGGRSHEIRETIRIRNVIKSSTTRALAPEKNAPANASLNASQNISGKARSKGEALSDVEFTLRHIPEGLKLTARQKEQARDPAPLPAGHPLTMRSARKSLEAELEALDAALGGIFATRETAGS